MLTFVLSVLWVHSSRETLSGNAMKELTELGRSTLPARGGGKWNRSALRNFKHLGDNSR